MADVGVLPSLQSVAEWLEAGWGRVFPPTFLALADFLLRG